MSEIVSAQQNAGTTEADKIYAEKQVVNTKLINTVIADLQTLLTTLIDKTSRVESCW